MSQITKEAVLCTFGAFSDETKEDTEKLVYTGSDAMVLNQARTDSLLTTALQKGLSGGGGDGTPIVMSSDNSVRSNTSNMMASAPIVTSNDTFTNAIASSV